ncbi:MAG: ABC transporter ATP-binding protein [Alphaproteobacteria bacterium]|nr:ABC transporter ATP-binding protein [Alphaproteobacteria bacterium]
MTDLALADVTVFRRARAALSGVSLSVRAGELVALLGPNGAGKTTLLRTALGLLKPDGGTVRLAGADPAALDARARARAIAYLPQARPLAWPIRIRDLVLLGRFAHAGGHPGPDDHAAAARALAACGLDALADRRATDVSGGELARAHIARALAAETPALAADEPAAGLDPGHAWRVMGLLRARADAGGAVLVSVHDPALAAAFADRVVVLAGGCVTAEGRPDAALTPDLMARVYGVRTGPSRLALEVTGLAP